MGCCLIQGGLDYDKFYIVNYKLEIGFDDDEEEEKNEDNRIRRHQNTIQ
jgi:hypothetical protein